MKQDVLHISSPISRTLACTGLPAIQVQSFWHQLDQMAVADA